MERGRRDRSARDGASAAGMGPPLRRGPIWLAPPGYDAVEAFALDQADLLVAEAMVTSDGKPQPVDVRPLVGHEVDRPLLVRETLAAPERELAVNRATACQYQSPLSPRQTRILRTLLLVMGSPPTVT